MDNVRQFLDVEAHHTSGTLVSSSSSTVGKPLDLGAAWGEGNEGSNEDVRVGILGGEYVDALYCPKDVFERSARKLGGEALFNPPPFAAPCTDGLLLIFTFFAHVDGAAEIRGGYVLIPKELLEQRATTSISRSWSAALKPTSTAAMLQKMGFMQAPAYCFN